MSSYQQRYRQRLKDQDIVRVEFHTTTEAKSRFDKQAKAIAPTLTHIKHQQKRLREAKHQLFLAMLDEVDIRFEEAQTRINALEAEIAILADKYFTPDPEQAASIPIPTAIQKLTNDPTLQTIIARLHKTGLELLAECRKYQGMIHEKR